MRDVDFDAVEFVEHRLDIERRIIVCVAVPSSVSVVQRELDLLALASFPECRSSCVDGCV